MGHVGAHCDIYRKGSVPAPELTAGFFRNELLMAKRDPAIADTVTETPGSSLPASASQASAADSEPRMVDRFVISHELGAGGMGVVLAARDPKLERDVAIKLLRPHAHGRAPHASRHVRLLREARSLARLAHPNVVAVHEVGTLADGTVFVAMELIKGQTLREWQRERPWQEIVAMYAGAGAGLTAAHASGIVHRDFKPDNVLVGEDGRPRVVDFGLAFMDRDGDANHDSDAESEAEPAARDAGSEAAASRLTAPGALMGTPGYMAPEQLAGELGDPRTDQFSFCVALYEALHGERPFADMVSSEGEVRAIRRPRPAQVPASWLWKALDRGLAVAPGDRFAGMDELLAELTRDRGRLRRYLVVAAALAILGSTSLVLAMRPAPASDPCPLPQDELAGIWDAGQKTRVQRALAGTGLSFAGQVWSTVEARLDRHARAWLAAGKDACEDTHVRRVQSPDLLDRRVACLAERKRSLATVARAFVDDPEHAADSAASLLDQLGDVSICANTEVLRLGLEPPRRAQDIERVSRVRDHLAASDALHAMGRYQAATAELEAGEALAAGLEYAPVRAEILHVRGRLDVREGELERAIESLRQAQDLALGARHDELVADIWLTLVRDAGPRYQRPAQVREWLRLTRASLRRLGHEDDPRELLLEHASGLVMAAQGHHGDAAEQLTRAIDAASRRWGTDDLRIAPMLIDRANARAMIGAASDALADYERALAIETAAFGPEHPWIASARRDLGLLLVENLGRLDQGQAEIEEARRIYAAARGHDSLEVGHAEVALAQPHLFRGQYEQALVHAERALGIYERQLDPHHPRRAEALNAVGVLRFFLADFAGSLSAYEQALAIMEPTLGAGHVDVGLVRSNIGETLLALAEPEQARTAFEQALAVLRAGWGPDHAELALPLKGLGLTELALDRPAAAAGHLEQALRLRDAATTDPQEIAEIEWGLARALLALGQGRARRRALAASALERYRGLGETWAERVRDIELWLQRTNNKEK
jgi:eukaryotic-like serine/threonine-protein kinase